MAKAQVAARFVTEVAPAKLVLIMRQRRKLPTSLLEPIAEDEREHQLAYCYGQDHHDHHRAAAWTTKRAPPQERERAGGLVMRELSKYFSDAHGHDDQMSWEQRSNLQAGQHRRAVYA